MCIWVCVFVTLALCCLMLLLVQWPWCPQWALCGTIRWRWRTLDPTHHRKRGQFSTAHCFVRDASVVSVLNLWRRKHGFCGDLLMALAGVHNNGVQAQSYRCKARSIIDQWCHHHHHHHHRGARSVAPSPNARGVSFPGGEAAPTFSVARVGLASIPKHCAILQTVANYKEKNQKASPAEVNRKRQTICDGRILQNHKHNQPLHSYSS